MSNKINASFTTSDMIIFIKACELISRCDANQAGAFVNEILMFHALSVRNAKTEILEQVDSVSINEFDLIQLNIRESENVNK